MSLFSIKALLLFLGCFLIQPLMGLSQPLRKMALITEFDIGKFQQKLNLGYEIRVLEYFSNINEENKRQVFLGLGFGIQNYNTFAFSIVTPTFVMEAKGYNLSFSITNAATKPKRRNFEKYKSNFLTFRVGFNRFNKVSAYYRNYNNSGWTGFNDIVNDPKCNSVDYELMFIKLVKLNSNNFIRLGITTGVRSGTITGIRSNKSVIDPNSTRFSKSLFPIIFKFNFGYQFHFGPMSRIKGNKNG